MSGSHNRHNKIESEKKGCRKQFRIIDESRFRRRILFCEITILDREPMSLEIVRDNSANISGTIETLAYTLINKSPCHKISETKKTKTVTHSTRRRHKSQWFLELKKCSLTFMTVMLVENKNCPVAGLRNLAP
jgi:hypothetical protein